MQYLDISFLCLEQDGQIDSSQQTTYSQQVVYNTAKIITNMKWSCCAPCCVCCLKTSLDGRFLSCPQSQRTQNCGRALTPPRLPQVVAQCNPLVGQQDNFTVRPDILAKNGISRNTSTGDEVNTGNMFADLVWYPLPPLLSPNRKKQIEDKMSPSLLDLN